MLAAPQRSLPPALGAPKLDLQNPWPGPAAYDEASHRFFYGRSKEAAELLRLVRLAPLTVLYGKSGLGKSSLLQAGLFPLLRAAHFLPVYVRLDFADGAEPALDQLGRRLGEELRAHHTDHPAFQLGESLWEYLHREKLEIWSPDNFPLLPVLVLDQFEELFSRCSSKVSLIQHVLDNLADLIENRIPAQLAAEAASAKRARLDLFSQNYRVLLSFREDFLPLVRTWEQKVPSLLRNYLRIEPLSRANAIDAVECPGQDVLEPGVASDIVDFVARDPASEATTSSLTIEPVLLSLCCARLNGRRAPGARIDKSLIDTEGRGILEGFYAEALADEEVKGPPDVAAFIEKHLIQGNHFRGDYPKEEALANGLLTPKQLAELTDKHRLLRVVPHPDTARIELIHDRLVPVVRKARDARKATEDAEALASAARQAVERVRQAQERAEERERAAKKIEGVLRRTRVWAIFAVVFALAAGSEWWRARGASLRAEGATRLAEHATGLARQEALQAHRAAERESFRALTASAVNQARIDPELASLLAVRALDMAEGLDAEAKRDAADTLSRVTDSRLRTSRKVCDSIRDVSFAPKSARLIVDCGDGAPHALAWPDLRDVPVHGSDDAWFGMPRFAPAGSQLAYVGSNQIHVLDAESGAEQWSATAPAAPNDVALSPDGNWLAAGGDRVWIWRRGSSAPPRVLSGQRRGDVQYVSKLAFSRSGALLASGGGDNLVHLWNVKSGQEIGVLRGHTAPISSIEFSPDDRSLVSAGEDETARIWDVTTKIGRATLQGHANSVFAASFSDDGRKIVTGSADGTVRLWDANSARELVRFPAHARPVAFARFVEEGRRVVSGGWDGYVRTWSSGGHTGRVKVLRFSADGKRVATASTDGTVRFWDTATGDEARVLPASRVPLSALATAEQGSLVATGDTDGCVRVWNGDTGEQIANFACQPDVISDLDFSPDGSHLVGAAESGGVLLWDLTHRAVRQTQPRTGFNSHTVQFSSDGAWIASTTADGSLWLLSGTGAGEARHVQAHSNRIFMTRFSPDSTLLLSTSQDSSARLTDVQSGEVRVTMGHSALVMDGAFIGGGAQLLTTTIGGELVLWDAKTGAKVRQIRAHAGKIQLDLSEDGSRLATFSWDRTVKVWDTRTWQQIATFTHDELVDGGAISPDGKFLATFTPYDIRITPIAPEALIQLARSRVSRDLTPEECEQYGLSDCSGAGYSAKQ